MKLVTDSTRYIIGNCIIYIGFGFLFYALYLALCEVIDVSLNPLGMEHSSEVKKVKKEKPKNLFETDKVFWDLIIAATFLFNLIIIAICFYEVLANV